MQIQVRTHTHTHCFGINCLSLLFIIIVIMMIIIIIINKNIKTYILKIIVSYFINQPIYMARVLWYVGNVKNVEKLMRWTMCNPISMESTFRLHSAMVIYGELRKVIAEICFRLMKGAKRLQRTNKLNWWASEFSKIHSMCTLHKESKRRP